ncbi:hypothetical protein DMUE_2279 [Dictyocoela muelleri]|nr:hypothetical protein DMUE_2279 [Dictyocoela muelleri]
MKQLTNEEIEEIRKELLKKKHQRETLLKILKHQKAAFSGLRNLWKKSKQAGLTGLCNNKLDKFEKLDNLIFEVFLNHRGFYISLNGSIFKSIALKISGKIRLRNFKLLAIKF